MKHYLIVVDMQNDFITGSLGSSAAQAIVPNVRRKIEEYVNKGNKVYFTQDTHWENYLTTPEGINLPVPHCLYCSEGWRVPEELACLVPEEENTYVIKNTFGRLDWDFLIAPDSIELVGVCTDICVVSNALILKATFPNAKIIVDASCCAGVTPEKHEAALEVMRSCQIEVI